MKILTMLMFLFLMSSVIISRAQVVSNVDWKLDGDDKIVITYDLAKQDNYIYFDVSVNVTIDKETIKPTALSGDVGNFIKVGTGKKIIWNLFQDISELNGELSVEVIASNPVPTNVTTTENGKTKQTPEMKLPPPTNIPFWVGMGGLAATGLGFMMNGLKTNSEGMDLYAIYKDNRSEGAAIYTELGSSRNEVYDDANKKHKSGTFLAIAGGTALAVAGYIMVNRIIQQKKANNRGFTFSPVIKIQRNGVQGKAYPQAGFTLRYRLH